MNDKALLVELQRHLKSAGSKYTPQDEHVALALRLARGDPGIATGTACKAACIAKGRLWVQIDSWRKQILTENLLVEGSSQPIITTADERRAKRAKLERDRYAAHGRAEKDVRDTIERLISRIENQANRELQYGLKLPQRWRCPVGCEPGCARDSFRLKCMPTRAAMQVQQRNIWEERHPVPSHPVGSAAPMDSGGSMRSSMKDGAASCPPSRRGNRR
jgi:hypothetical protein